MANFICPFSKKVCNPSCKYWEFDNSSPTKKLLGFIPINFTMRDLMTSNILLTNQVPFVIRLFMNEYQKYYDLYHPEETSTPKGRCKKIENLHRENFKKSDEKELTSSED